jgi:glutathione-regulated potassium-efflux system protein KefB
MDPKSFVYSAVLLLVVASVAVTIFRHFGLGSILGLLVTGVIVGPHTPGPFLTLEVDGIRQFTELGVVLLLFLIGLEMKPRRLWDMRHMLFGLGSLQVVLTTLAIAALYRAFDASWSIAFVFGASFALSSTAFVMQMLREQGEIASKYGNIAFAILLMQDLAVVPLQAVVPMLAHANPEATLEPALLSRFVEPVTLVAAVVLGGRYVVPKVLDFLARRNNREGFFLVAMAAMFMSALAMEHSGMSMGLGAFIMGMMLSTSRYSHQVEASIEPHKGLLMSLFFVAVGMSVDVGALANAPLQFGAQVLAVIAIKAAVIFGLCRLFGIQSGTALRVAFLLPQGGEFGFVVFGAAKAIGIIDDQAFAMGVAVISVTMLFTPLLTRLGGSLARRIPDRVTEIAASQTFELHKHESNPRVVIAGYGRVGHTVGTILAHTGIPYIAFDTDANLIDQWRRQGHPVFYGDIGNPALLGNQSLKHVELVVLTIDNGKEALRAAKLIRAHAPQMQIVARARDLKVCDEFYKIGVREAVPETLEASLRIAVESLEVLGASSDETASMLSGLRGADYSLVRNGPEAGTGAPRN